MLAVTEVNGCRYCAYAHARIALAAGVTRADVDALAEETSRVSPPEQIPALLYAQHWAETGATPDPGGPPACLGNLRASRRPKPWSYRCA